MTAIPDPPRLGRRDVLRLGAGAAAAVLAGCSSSRSARPPVTTAPSPGTTTTMAAPTTILAAGPEAWYDFGRSLSGRLVRPSDSGYLTDLQLFDSRFDAVRPEGIAYCASATDVQRSIAFARDHGLPFAARSGGHSYAGYSTTTGLVIDVTSMATVSSGSGSATVGAGARLIDVYSSLNAAGVSIPAGSCPTVGIAGLTLGGGVGVVDRAYGLTCDALSSIEMVTADARLVTASATLNPDLYWACRGGGGGNFGIATSFDFSTFQTSPLTLAFLTWPWSAAADVLPAWLGWAPQAVDQLWSNCILGSDPMGSDPTLQVGVVWIGSPSGISAPLAELAAAVGSNPSSRYLETVPFEHAMYVEGGCASFSRAACHLPNEMTGGLLSRQPSLAKSGYISAPLGDAGVQAVIGGIQARQSQRAAGALGLDAYGGAVNRVDPSATAFVHRSALASAQFNVPFQPGTPSAQLDASLAWLETWYSDVRPYMDGSAYQNYIDAGLAGWADAYYGANLSRLSQVKKKWDPDDAFHFAQSIPL
jgi:FAD binding domain-containing protein/berberine-like enzyme